MCKQVNYQMWESRLLWNQIWVLLICSGLLLAPVTGTRADDLDKAVSTNIDIEDLILGWTNFRNKVVLIEGAVLCYDDDYCRFRPVAALHRVVPIDLDVLALADRRRIILGCHEHYCQLIVRAIVNPDDVTAYTVTYRQ